MSAKLYILLKAKPNRSAKERWIFGRLKEPNIMEYTSAFVLLDELGREFKW